MAINKLFYSIYYEELQSMIKLPHMLSCYVNLLIFNINTFPTKNTQVCHQQLSEGVYLVPSKPNRPFTGEQVSVLGFDSLRALALAEHCQKCVCVFFVG